jgi:hypothetical protein
MPSCKQVFVFQVVGLEVVEDPMFLPSVDKCSLLALVVSVNKKQKLKVLHV